MRKLLFLFGFAVSVYGAEIYQSNFDNLTTGTVPVGWTNSTGNTSTFAVTTSNPVSGTKGFGFTPGSNGQSVIYTGATAQADMAGQLSQRVNLSASGTGTNGNGATAGLLLRSDSGANNFYLASCDFGFGTFLLFKNVGGTFTHLGSSPALPSTYTDGNQVNFKAEIQGSTIRMKVWIYGSVEPSWQYTTTDTSITAAGFLGIWGGQSGSATGSTALSVDNLFIGDAGSSFGLTLSPTSITQSTTGNAVTLSAPSFTSWTTGTPGSPSFAVSGGTSPRSRPRLLQRQARPR